MLDRRFAMKRISIVTILLLVLAVLFYCCRKSSDSDEDYVVEKQELLIVVDDYEGQTNTDWMWLMRKIIEKTDFSNAKAGKVCEKVMSVSVQMHQEPYIYAILR